MRRNYARRRGATASAAVLVWAAFASACQPLGPERGEVPEEGEAAPPEAAPADPALGKARGDRDPPEADEVEYVVGAACKEAGRGRPALRPVFARAGAWYGEAAPLGEVIERGASGPIAVFGWDGRRAGLLSPTGAVEEEGEDLLIGSYMGSPPCSEEAALGEEREEAPACVRALGGCGVGVARTGGNPGGANVFGGGDEPPEVRTGRACIAEGALVVDIDGRGAEAFPLAGFAEGRAPTELVASQEDPPRCEAAFGLEAMFGQTRIDVLAVADFGDSGRLDVLLGVGEGDSRRWVLYSATATPARLDKVASAPAPRAESERAAATFGARGGAGAIAAAGERMPRGGESARPGHRAEGCGELGAGEPSLLLR